MEVFLEFMDTTDITPEDSVVPVFLVPLSEEELEERRLLDLALEEEKTKQEQLKNAALAKLQKLGLTEEEAKAIAGV